MYSYDANGNMTRREEYAFNTGTLSGTPLWEDEYSYGNSSWKDQLTHINGTLITYDAIGNPLRYRDNMVFSWKSGRLASSVTTIDKNLSFLYDRNGLRVRKTVKTLGLNTSVEHNYDYAGGNLIRESYGDIQLWFMYDGSGSPIGFRRQVGTISTPYYYVKNLQGDIVAIARGGDGAILARYTYDSWGNILSITDDNGNDISGKPNEIANINPLRYRGYYYDTETELYYLKSRFYDPATGRFVNADSITDGSAGLLATNLYAYVANNPVNNSDPTGHWIIKDAIKWVAKNIAKPAVKRVRKIISHVSMTTTNGVGVTLSPSLFTFSAQLGISIDTSGNAALQITGTGGFTGGTPSASVVGYNMTTNAPTVSALLDEGYQTGGSAGALVSGVPVLAGAEINIVPNENNTKSPYLGRTVSLGVGTPGAELHIEWGKTFPVGPEINLFKAAEVLYIKIMEW